MTWMEVKSIQPVAIQDFAEEHGLKMEVREVMPRYIGDPVGPRYVWHASFKGAEVKDGSMLKSALGSDGLQHVAIQKYCDEIAGCLLVIDAYKETRREIVVPEKLFHACGD